MCGLPGDVSEEQSSFSNLFITSPMSQLILQPFCCFTYITAQSPTLLLLHLHHSSFSNPSAALPTSQLLLQPFSCCTYATPHSPTLLPRYLLHSSFSNPSVASPMSQLILQPFCRFAYGTGYFTTLPLVTYVTGTSRSPTSPGEPPMHRGMKKTVCGGLACYSKLLSLEVATVLDSC